MQTFMNFVLIANIVGFVVMGIDKKNAISGLLRVPEKTLISIAIFGGSVGILTGMNFFRHKTKKPKFFIGVPLIIGLQVLVFLKLFSFI